MSGLEEKKESVIEDIEIVSRVENEKDIYIIKNLNNDKMYIFNEMQYLIFKALDGSRTVDGIIKYMALSGYSIKGEQIEKFIYSLDERKLLKKCCSEYGKEQKVAYEKKRKTFLQKMLFIKIPIINPDRFLDKIVKGLDFVFTRAFAWFLVVYILIACTIYFIYFSPGRASLISDAWQNNLITLVLIWIITIIGSFLHELSHGITCKRYGGRVKEIGILIIYFRPGLFCNISDSYLFKDKSKRILVSLAGIILDFTIWSTVIICGFIVSKLGYTINFLPAFGLYGIITILLELNPLIKLDGYYIITELMEIYNLRENSFKYFKNILEGSTSVKAISRRERIIYIIYGVSAGIYSGLLIVYTCYILMEYLISKLSFIGKGLSILILILLFWDFGKKLLLLLIRIIASALSRREKA